MNLQGIRWKIVVQAFLLTFILCLGGARVYRKEAIIKPLEQRLRALPGVHFVEVVPEENQVKITLGVDSGVVLQKLLGDVRKGEVGRVASLVLLDHPSEELLWAFGSMQFSIQEAIVLGNFLEMGQRIAKEARKKEVEYRLMLDEEYIYLSLWQGEFFLHRVVSRGEGLRVESMALEVY